MVLLWFLDMFQVLTMSFAVFLPYLLYMFMVTTMSFTRFLNMLVKSLPGSRFFISIKDDAGWADNRYVAFGRVVEGMDVVHQIERVKVDGGSNRPKSPVIVDACGLL